MAEILSFPDHFKEMDEAKVSSLHWKIMFISGMGFFTDAYDLFIIGVVMTMLKPLWHVGKVEESLVESTALIASAFGALLFGRVADMLGRKRIYGVEVLVLAAGAIACAFSPSIWWLIGLRFILGIGIGGDYPVSATIMSEYAGKASGGMMVTLVFAMQAAGLIVGPLFASALLVAKVPHDIAWRILVAFGAVPALAVYSRRHLKETPRFLHAAGPEEDAGGKLVKAKHYDPRKHSVSFWDGFHRLVNNNRLLSRLIGASAAWFLRGFTRLVAFGGCTRIDDSDGLCLLRQHGFQSHGLAVPWQVRHVATQNHDSAPDIRCVRGARLCSSGVDYG
jgi:MFS transporter, PHS family, inorganic phosphate transporter